MSRPSVRAPVRSAGSPARGALTSLVSSLGRIRRSSVVAKTTASSVSPDAVVTSVVTSVPAGRVTVSGWGADSQKSTSAEAADGGYSWMPSRSRKAR